MSSKFLFDQKALQQVEKDFSKLKLDPTAKKYIDEFSKIWTKFLPMSELAIKGFSAFTMRDFQMQTHIDSTTVINLPKVERIKHSETMLNIMVEKIAKTLVHKEQKDQLEKAIKEVWAKISQI